MMRPGKLRQAMHMPLRFSRPARYEVTAVRCERVNQISREDAQAEGCVEVNEPAQYDFEILWNSIHGPGAFERGSWVWVYEFRRIK